jgi:hypothetical protein
MLLDRTQTDLNRVLLARPTWVLLSGQPKTVRGCVVSVLRLRERGGAFTHNNPSCAAMAFDQASNGT